MFSEGDQIEIIFIQELNHFSDCPTLQVRELEYIGLLNHRDVTGADISPAGDTLAIACYDDGWSYTLPDGMTWVEYLALDPSPTCELQLAEENQRESITVTETAYWTVSEGSSPLYYYARL